MSLDISPTITEFIRVAQQLNEGLSIKVVSTMKRDSPTEYFPEGQLGVDVKITLFGIEKTTFLHNQFCEDALIYGSHHINSLIFRLFWNDVKRVKMHLIIDEAYQKYLVISREEYEKFRSQNPDALINYREDSKEHFIESVKQNKHWFTGKSGFADDCGLKIEDRELTWEEKLQWVMTHTDVELYIDEEVAKETTPTRLTTITYNNETIEVYE